MIAVVHETTGRQVQLRTKKDAELYLANGWKEVKDGSGKPRRSGTVPAKSTDKRGTDKG